MLNQLCQGVSPVQKAAYLAAAAGRGNIEPIRYHLDTKGVAVAVSLTVPLQTIKNPEELPTPTGFV